ncbi:MAG: integrase zinc binding domain-containing protein, partial [Cyanobacteria bacterium J06582_2]
MVDAKDFAEEPIQVIEYLQINKVAGPNPQMEENPRESELSFLADLRTIIKETSRDQDMIATIIGLETKDETKIPDTYSRQYKQLSTRWGIVFLDDRIVIPTGMRESVLNALHFGHPGESKMLSDSKIFWWPGMADEIKKKQKECTACRNAGKNLKTQIPKTDKS